MICNHVELTMQTTEPRDVAKAMIKFWLYQHEQAKIQYEACRGRLEGGKRANKAAAEAWAEDDECVGFGGPPKPFSDNEIEVCERNLPRLKKYLVEAIAMAGYMVNYITEKAHENEVK